MNDTFRSYVTSTAFSISLSQNQIAALDAILRLGQEWIEVPFQGRNDHITPFRGLQRRGLAEFHGEKEGNVWLSAQGRWKDPAWRITPAGQLMHALLVEAGLCSAIDKRRRAEAKRRIAA